MRHFNDILFKINQMKPEGHHNKTRKSQGDRAHIILYHIITVILYMFFIRNGYIAVKKIVFVDVC